MRNEGLSRTLCLLPSVVFVSPNTALVSSACIIASILLRRCWQEILAGNVPALDPVSVRSLDERDLETRRIARVSASVTSGEMYGSPADAPVVVCVTFTLGSLVVQSRQVKTSVWWAPTYSKCGMESPN